MPADALRTYCAACPGLEIRDVLKYLHQSFFGCAHLVEDFDRALKWVKEEAEVSASDTLPCVEALPGNYSRVHLKALDDGLSPETLTNLFVLSAQPAAPGASEALEKALEEFISLAARGLVPFEADAVTQAVTAWKAAGYPACRHSEAFRDRYHPAYRVVRNDFIKFLPLFCRIDRLLTEMPPEKHVTVAVDGRCTSGKTTLAAMLARIYDATVFHMDDFFLRPGQRTEVRLHTPGENVDHERFLEEVLLPLSAGKAVQYVRYDCQSQTLLPAVTVTPGRLVVTEGSYSLHPELAAFYDLKVMLTVSPAEQMRRIRSRNTPEAAARFESTWIPLEERYLEACRVRETADLILENE